MFAIFSSKAFVMRRLLKHIKEDILLHGEGTINWKKASVVKREGNIFFSVDMRRYYYIMFVIILLWKEHISPYVRLEMFMLWPNKSDKRLRLPEKKSYSCVEVANWFHMSVACLYNSSNNSHPVLCIRYFSETFLHL